MNEKPLCYRCEYRRVILYDCHSACINAKNSVVKGDPHGIKNGWFAWPYNFDPIWLESCTGFKEKK